MTVAIIGPGLIGRSVALAARRADPAIDVVEIDRGESLEPARGADLIVVSTPVDAILEILERQAGILRTAVTIDTGSTKRAIVAAARAQGLASFVGGHPMAGGTNSGPGDARADLFDRRPWFLVPGGAAEDALRRAKSFVETLGATAVVMTDDGSEHDRAMAALSHLPQVVASLLMIVAGTTAGEQLQWAGQGLRDATRLAQSSGRLWESILATNADELAPLLRELARHLDVTADRLDADDSVAEMFETARRWRALL